MHAKVGGFISPFLDQHGCGQRGQVLSSHQLGHQGLGLGVEATGRRGQQAGVVGVAEKVREELVVGWHGRAHILVPIGSGVAIHLQRTTKEEKEKEKEVGGWRHEETESMMVREWIFTRN